MLLSEVELLSEVAGWKANVAFSHPSFGRVRRGSVIGTGVDDGTAAVLGQAGYLSVVWKPLPPVEEVDDGEGEHRSAQESDDGA